LPSENAARQSRDGKLEQHHLNAELAASCVMHHPFVLNDLTLPSRHTLGQFTLSDGEESRKVNEPIAMRYHLFKPFQCGHEAIAKQPRSERHAMPQFTRMLPS